jgi:hypothetical protein
MTGAAGDVVSVGTAAILAASFAGVVCATLGVGAGVEGRNAGASPPGAAAEGFAALEAGVAAAIEVAPGLASPSTRGVASSDGRPGALLAIADVSAALFDHGFHHANFDPALDDRQPVERASEAATPLAKRTRPNDVREVASVAMAEPFLGRAFRRSSREDRCWPSSRSVFGKRGGLR